MTQAGVVRPSTTVRAMVWMIGALFSFSAAAIAGREASHGATALEIMLYRSVISLAIVSAALFAQEPRLAALRTKKIGLHGLRAATHFLGQYSWLYALTLIPLAQLFALEFTAPIWIAIMAPLLLGEHLTRTRVLAAALGFTGTLLVARPGALGLDLGVTMGLLSAIGFASSLICTKTLTKTDRPLLILFYMCLFQTAFSLILLSGGLRLLAPLPGLWAALFALAGLTAHYCLVRAFALADAVIVAPMDFLRLPLIAIVGALLYAEPLNPLVLAGGAVVIAGNIINLWGERHSARRPEAG